MRVAKLTTAIVSSTTGAARTDIVNSNKSEFLMDRSFMVDIA
jgi:hypothetical protein